MGTWTRSSRRRCAWGSPRRGIEGQAAKPRGAGRRARGGQLAVRLWPKRMWWYSVGALAAAVCINLATPVVAATLLGASLRTFLPAAGLVVTLEASPVPAVS